MAEHRGDPEHPRRIAEDWLSLRETLDAEARRPSLDAVRRLLAAQPPATVVDVGCGTGSGGRWLLPLLAGEETWVLLDHDADLLEHTAERLQAAGAEGRILTRCADLDALGGLLDSAEGPALVICSALLDLLTPEQLRAMTHALDEHGAPFLLALSVTGEIALEPPAPEDELFAEAFNRHQRQGGRCGPEAADLTRVEMQTQGFDVEAVDTHWRLDAADPDPARLDALRRFLTDRADAAEEQLRLEGRSEEADSIVSGWLPRRLAQIEAGALRLELAHIDLLGVPSPR